MSRDAFVLEIQRELCHLKCARNVSGPSRNGPLSSVIQWLVNAINWIKHFSTFNLILIAVIRWLPSLQFLREISALNRNRRVRLPAGVCVRVSRNACISPLLLLFAENRLLALKSFIQCKGDRNLWNQSKS